MLALELCRSLCTSKSLQAAATVERLEDVIVSGRRLFRAPRPRSWGVVVLLVVAATINACTTTPAATTASTTSSTMDLAVAGPTTTSTPLPANVCPPEVKCASAATVRHFVQLAKNGRVVGYWATYRFLATARPPLTFVYATRRAENRVREYLYEVAVGGVRFRAVHLATGHSPTDFYECLKRGARPWSCYGPDPSQGNGGIEEVLAYDVALDYLRPLNPPLNASSIRSRDIGRFKSTCLTFTFQGPVARTTWCVTSNGILDYLAGLDLYRPIELVRLSPDVPPGLFRLPASAAAWPLGWENDPGGSNSFNAREFDVG
jgi:hypothetical protein